VPTIGQPRDYMNACNPFYFGRTGAATPPACSRLRHRATSYGDGHGKAHGLNPHPTSGGR